METLEETWGPTTINDLKSGTVPHMWAVSKSNARSCFFVVSLIFIFWTIHLGDDDDDDDGGDDDDDDDYDDDAADDDDDNNISWTCWKWLAYD